MSFTQINTLLRFKWLKFLIIEIFSALQKLPFLFALSRNGLILIFVFFSAKNLLHRSYFILAKDVNVEVCLQYSHWLGRLLIRRLDRNGFSALTFTALCHILPSRFLLGVFQKHLPSISHESDCLAIMMHKGLSRSILHDSRNAPFTQVEAYHWTLETVNNLAERGDIPNLLNYMRWFGNSPPLTSAVELRQMAETFRKIERMADKLEIPVFSEDQVTANRKLRVGLFRYDYAQHSEGGTGEVDLLKTLLISLPSDASFFYLGLTVAPDFTIGGHPYIKLNSDVKTAIEEIRELSLDVVIFTPPLWGSFLNFMNQLIAHRVAKNQIYFAGDVMTSGMPTLDYWAFSCPGNRLLANYQQGFTEKLLNISPVPLPSPPLFNSENHAFMDTANRKVIYVTNCHILKINDELLCMWADILYRVPNSQIILYPYSNAHHRLYAPILKQLITSVCVEKRIDHCRFVIKDIAGSSKISAELAKGHIYLDSFPYTGSFSTAQALSIGLPCVCLASDEANHMELSKDIARTINLEIEIVMSDRESYVHRAVELGLRSEFRQKLAKQILERISSLPIDQLNRNYSDRFWKSLDEIVR